MPREGVPMPTYNGAPWAMRSEASIKCASRWSAVNRAMSVLRSIYRRPCVDHDRLRNPVDLWLAGGGKFRRKVRRRNSAPAKVLPCWRAGIETEVDNPAIRDAHCLSR